MAVLRYLWSLKWSFAGCVAALGASFISLGMLGYALYYLAYPIVGFVYPPLTDWRGDTVWPLIIGAGILWAPSFLVAGVVDHVLAARGASTGRRKIVYLVILWLGAVAAWLFLITNGQPPLRR